MDREVREAVRAWRANPGQSGLLEVAIASCRRSGQQVPPTLLAATPRWRRVASFVGRWFDRAIADEDGVEAGELEATEARLGLRLPPAIREWHELLGRRAELVEPGRVSLLTARDLRVVRGTLWLAASTDEDTPAWGVRVSSLGDDDPQTVGIGARYTITAIAPVSVLALLLTLARRALRADSRRRRARSASHPWPALPLPPLVFGEANVFFHGDGDVLVADCAQDDGTVRVAGRTPKALAAAATRLSRDR